MAGQKTFGFSGLCTKSGDESVDKAGVVAGRPGTMRAAPGCSVSEQMLYVPEVVDKPVTGYPQSGWKKLWTGSG
jgi:hypothetical protein